MADAKKVEKKIENVVKTAGKKFEAAAQTAEKKAETMAQTAEKKAETVVKKAEIVAQTAEKKAEIVAQKAETVIKTASQKATAPKAAAPKAAAPKADPVANVVIEYMGKSIAAKDVLAGVKKAFAKAHKDTVVKTIDLYIKPEEGVAYYVVNGVGADEYKIML
ncbi:MAG: DUF6465 family protein [Hungatella sp.]